MRDYLFPAAFLFAVAGVCLLIAHHGPRLVWRWLSYPPPELVFR